MFNKLSYQLINSLAVSQAVLCYIQNISKIITEKKSSSFSGNEQRRDSLLAKLI